MEKTGHVENCGQVCGDDRFELIDKIEKDIISATNITKDEEKVLSNILFRLWQRDWLRNSNDIDDMEAKADAYDSLVSKTVMSDAELDAPLAQRILREMAEKAESYDRLMNMNSLSKNDIQIVLDGNAWCAYRLPFRNLQEDIAGFGVTPQMALTALLESELPDGWEES